MKAFTDIEQSKILATILPLESADMHYNVVGDAIIGDYQSGISSAKSVANAYMKNPDEFAKSVTPCWSLTALLSLLPRPTLHQTNDGKWYCDITDNRTYFSKHYDNPVDACVEMILKLKKLNILK